MLILEDIKTKLEAWNHCYPDEKNPNSPYRCILKARGSGNSNVNVSGHVTQKNLDLIKTVLRDHFGMDYQVDDSFPSKLNKKLQEDGIKAILKRFRNLRIYTTDLKSIKSDTAELYRKLSASGSDGLSFRDDHFYVGATKTMNFLFPELFIIIDKWVAQALNLYSYNNFESYWSTLERCYNEIKKWCEINGDVSNLIALDYPPSTPIRIFDKCTTVMGNPKVRKFLS
jgi:hypothetical protein